jgi:putative Ca2+/H+ antiporter (TMEM165/GDT1 family)
MEAFLVSAGLVAVAEMGDKTQLLAIFLAARFKTFWPIVWGILVATVLNHAAAAYLGALFATWLTGDVLRYVLIASFVAMGLWVLVPDAMDDELNAPKNATVFVATVIAFFLAEMGDKTQLATVAMGAKFDATLWVTLGTTAGMMLANVPAVYFGPALLKRIPVAVMRYTAAAFLLALAVATFVWGGPNIV